MSQADGSSDAATLAGKWTGRIVGSTWMGSEAAQCPPTAAYSAQKGFCWKRTRHSQRGKQNPEQKQIKQADLDTLKLAAQQRRLLLSTTPPLPVQPQTSRQAVRQVSKAYFPSPSLKLRQIWQRATQRYSLF